MLEVALRCQSGAGQDDAFQALIEEFLHHWTHVQRRHLDLQPLRALSSGDGVNGVALGIVREVFQLFMHLRQEAPMRANLAARVVEARHLEALVSRQRLNQMLETIGHSQEVFGEKTPGSLYVDEAAGFPVRIQHPPGVTPSKFAGLAKIVQSAKVTPNLSLHFIDRVADGGDECLEALHMLLRQVVARAA